MSKIFFSFASRDRERTQSTINAAAKPSSTAAGHKEKDQVSVLYELGLLSDSDKRTRRREKGQGREEPSGARVAGSHPKKSTQQIYAEFI
jgi:hypothetical protein